MAMFWVLATLLLLETRWVFGGITDRELGSQNYCEKDGRAINLMPLLLNLNSTNTTRVAASEQNSTALMISGDTNVTLGVKHSGLLEKFSLVANISGRDLGHWTLRVNEIYSIEFKNSRVEIASKIDKIHTSSANFDQLLLSTSEQWHKVEVLVTRTPNPDGPGGVIKCQVAVDCHEFAPEQETVTMETYKDEPVDISVETHTKQVTLQRFTIECQRTNSLDSSCEKIGNNEGHKEVENINQPGAGENEKEQKSQPGAGEHKEEQKSQAGAGGPKEEQKSQPGAGGHKEEQKSQAGAGGHKEEQKSQPGAGGHKEEQKSQPGAGGHKEEQKSQPGAGGHKEEQKSQAGAGGHKEEQKSQPGAGGHKEEQKSQPGADKHKEEQKSQPGADKHKEEQKSQPGADKHKEEQKSQPGAGGHKEEQKSQPGAGGHKEEQKNQPGAGAPVIINSFILFCTPVFWYVLAV